MLKNLLRRMVLPMVKLKDCIKGKPTYHKLTDKPVEFQMIIKTKIDGDIKRLVFKIKKETYLIKYPIGLFNQERHMYSIHCLLPDGDFIRHDTDFDLRRHYITPIYVSSLLSWAYDEKKQLQAVIAFFLDIKMGDLPDSVKPPN